jgi:CelD/BcsL family acetyltransferase involved in cellulose biosynthesis
MHIDVGLAPLPPREELQAWWRELEARADTTFYTSWSWIGSWLSILPAELQPHMLLARQGERIVGMGLVVKGKARLLRSFSVNCWRLHETGVEEFDEMTIEYNDFLADRTQAQRIKRAMLHHLLYQTGIKRLEVSKADHRFGDVAGAALGGSLKDVLIRSVASTSYVVDLDRVRQSNAEYLCLLSANTRSHIRRSITAYKGLGPLRIEAASSTAQARAFLTTLKTLHGRTWSQRGVQSSLCTSPTVQRFHDALIEDAFERGEVQMLRVTAGDTDLGYLYNFVHRGRVVFYQSGFNYGVLDKHDRPGLVCHNLAVEHNVQLGHSLYDFAAGDYRYKASLSTHCEPQSTHVLERDGLLPRLDIQLRALKQRLREWRARGTTLGWSMLAALWSSDMDIECPDWLLNMPMLA